MIKAYISGIVFCENRNKKMKPLDIAVVVLEVRRSVQ